MNGDCSMKEGTEQMVERHISEAVNDRTLGELALFASSVEEKKEPCILCAFGCLAHSRNSRLRLFTEDTRL